MNLAARMILILTLMLSAVVAASAQTSTTTGTLAETVTVAEEQPTETASPTTSSYELRNQFTALLRQSPSELASILTLDPGLMSNEAFLSGHPQLAKFLAAHPEILRSPRFYLREFERPDNPRDALDDILETLMIFSTFALVAFALAWLIRTIVEQKRWNRLARTQTEAHNKILDRFSTSEELIAYIKTPAGTKFLESAPIPLREQTVPNAPLSRILWSIQVGVVVAAAGLGTLLVSGRLVPESAQGLFVLGVIAFSVGAGFIASAAVSIYLSRRFGLWQGPEAPRANVFEDSGAVR